MFTTLSRPIRITRCWGLPNVIYTPHLGASTQEAQDIVGTQAAEVVINALVKHRYDNVRNRAVFEKIQQ